MKLFRFLFILIAAVQFLNAQQKLPDSLKIAWETAQNDSVRFKVSRAIYTFYEEINRDSAFHYAQLRYHLAQKYHRKIEEAYLLGQMAYQQIYLGLYSEALTNLTAAFQIITLARDAATWEITPFDTPGKSREITLSMLNHMYGHLKLQTGSKESIPYFKEGRRIGKEIGNHFRVTVADMVLSTNYLMLEDPDSALIYAQEGELYARQGGVLKYLAYLYWVTGDIYIKKQIDSLGLNYFHKSLQLAIPEGNYSVVAGVYESLINYYKLKGNQDSLLVYASNSLAVIKSMGAITSIILSDVNLGKAYQHMADAYALKGKVDSTNKYLQLALAIKDSLTASKLARLAIFQRQTLDEQLRVQHEEKRRIAAENKRNNYLFLAGILVAVMIILLVYRNNRQKQKANKLLQATLMNLKSTQSQLIQSEKMASLGELTAGIAHEIQNPLNFVNNFSEVNKELAEELELELEKGNSAEVKALAKDIRENQEKILHHGQRADAIVKSMLQHSRISTGQKEPTDINALCDEYLRLAYHGLRAKDNSFQANFKTDFQTALPKIMVVPQDLGRVLLNLINNAFYAVHEKAKQNLEKYTPEVIISTQRITHDRLQITVKDNGSGIPDTIKDKIFQPFFTTKPTGQGTGLGLSLSYDIVKAHQGELKVKTQEHKGTELYIILPL